MKNSTVFKTVATVAIVIILIVLWVFNEQKDSYSEPHDAINAVDKELLLIPAFKAEDESLYFFIKDKNNLGAVKVRKGLTGWKTGMFSWSPMDSKRKYEELGGYQGHGENLIYGLIRNGDQRLVTVDGQEAEFLNLAMLPPSLQKEYNVEGLYLWYFESDEDTDHEELKLLNKDSHTVIQSINL
ncbi:aspartyl-tRNA synthetase [Bacillus sp. AK031]